jgi:predicted nucleotidyltransferase
MLIEKLQNDIRTIGVLELSRRTGISRSILHKFAAKKASMNAKNIEKLLDVLAIEIVPRYNIDSLKNVPCDPAKKLDILKIAKILRTTYLASKVILFGSQAKGTWSKDSDIDFLVVRHSDKAKIDPGGERILTFREGIKSPYDVVTVAENKLEQSLKDPASVISLAFRTGAVLDE